MPPSLRAKEPIDDVGRRQIAAACRGRALAKGQRYFVTMMFYGNWDTLDGGIRRRDVHNLPSKLIDVLATCLGVDDSQFRKWAFEAIHKDGPEHVHITITDYRPRRA
jgi:hypothetical protein